VVLEWLASLKQRLDLDLMSGVKSAKEDHSRASKDSSML